jgi:hypothetical protein
VKLRLQNSQSQKNTGVRLIARPEPESRDLAIATDSKANNFPFPSFRNKAVHVGLAHLPSMGIVYVKFSRRTQNFAHAPQLVGISWLEMIWRRKWGNAFSRILVSIREDGSDIGATNSQPAALKIANV